MFDEKRLRELLGFFARQYVVDCHALMDMDVGQTARSMAHDLTPEEMRDMADILTETDAETALTGLSARVAKALRTLADKSDAKGDKTQ